ncbi:hypothetical protein RI129_007912 [Pyrocoelia pectoralis]|uniref:Uncharacterized protein n=1 Tax=Pyrocoelia pectoralis TaxID=417401 RepID=A0AAN7VAJ0_9COLE
MDSINKRNHRNVPPDGGWGYLVAISFTISLIVGILSTDTVGIVFGPYLQQIGQEARDVIQISSVSHMAMLFAGLPLNVLLQKISCRKVAFLGSFIYLLGCLLTIFSTSTFQMTVTYGVLKGCGIGLVCMSAMAMLKEYFDKRRNFINNCCHVSASILATTFPTFSANCIRIYGFRGTIIIWTGIGMHLIVAAAFLQPVKWHMEKRLICDDEMIEMYHKEKGVIEANNEIYDDIPHTPSIQSRFRKLITVVYNTLDLGLFKVPSYVNIAFGVSLTVASDVLFISLLPWLLNHYHSDNSHRNLLITIFFTADLVGKVLLCIISRFVSIRNRYLFLVNTYVVGIFRLVTPFGGLRVFAQCWDLFVV